jgi:hypothetical protein
MELLRERALLKETMVLREKEKDSRVIHKVKQTQHQNLEFVHT